MDKTLNEFLSELRKDIDRFEFHWNNMMVYDPEKYPKMLSEQEWQYKFIDFLNNESK